MVIIVRAKTEGSIQLDTETKFWYGGQTSFIVIKDSPDPPKSIIHTVCCDANPSLIFKAAPNE
jgi:hypothetical protein